MFLLRRVAARSRQFHFQIFIASLQPIRLPPRSKLQRPLRSSRKRTRNEKRRDQKLSPKLPWPTQDLHPPSALNLHRNGAGLLWHASNADTVRFAATVARPVVPVFAHEIPTVPMLQRLRPRRPELGKLSPLGLPPLSRYQTSPSPDGASGFPLSAFQDTQLPQVQSIPQPSPVHRFQQSRLQLLRPRALSLLQPQSSHLRER